MPCLPTRVKGCTLRNIWYLYEKRNKQTNKQIKTAKQIHVAYYVGVCLLSDKA